MALSDVPGRVTALRAHLARSIPDQDDRRVADEHLLRLLESFGASRDDEGGELMGERLRGGEDPTLSGVGGRTGFDARPNLYGLGLDHLAPMDRRPRSSSERLDKLLAKAVAPMRAEWAR